MHPLNTLYTELSNASARGLLDIAIASTRSGLYKTTLHFPDTTSKDTIMRLYNHILTLYKPHFDYINYAEFPKKTTIIFIESIAVQEVPARTEIIVDTMPNVR